MHVTLFSQDKTGSHEARKTMNKGMQVIVKALAMVHAL